jgi:hypothetical protein
MRTYAGTRAVVFANFSETPQQIPTYVFDQYSVYSKNCLHGMVRISSKKEITIEA